MPDNRLDDHIKKQLAQYEAAFDSSDWDQMEAVLDTEDWDDQIRNKLALYAVPLDAAAWNEMASHLDSPFDTYVRKKLERFSTRFNPADWARMAMLLDDSLESSIRARLEGYEAPFLPATGWSGMVGTLDATFDETIRNKFDEFVPSAEMEEDWSLLLAGMASPLDRSVHDKLAEYKAGYHPTEWLQMEALLDATKDDDGAWWYVRWQTYAVAASFILIAMLSIGGVNLLSGRLWNAEKMTEVKAPSQRQTLQQPTQPETAFAPSAQNPDREKEEMRLPSKAEAGPAMAPDRRTEKNNKYPVLAHSEAESSRIDPIDPSASFTQDPIGLSVPAIAAAERVDFNPDGNESNAEFAGESEKSRPAPGRKFRKDIALTSIAHSRHPVTLGFFQSELDELLGGKAPSIDARVNLRNPEIRLGLYLATTHSVAELNDASQPGLGVGLRAEVRFDEEWSIVSGVLLTHKRFSHKYYIFADDRTQWENVLDANFRALEVPILVKYRFPASKKVQLYAQAGLATMVTLEENYLRYNPLSFENADRISRSVDKDQHIPTSQKLTLSTYVGNIQVAGGVEYEVSKRLSLQVEPYFQWGLQPMGTEQKSLHSLGVGTGLVYTFGNKSS